ncbi:MAG: hypothetical protein IPK19_11465 [Chloroflexi bacterium]|nr:hypothetical protein [Chloroflexota bacterium]
MIWSSSASPTAASRASASPAGQGRWSSGSCIDDDGQVEHLTRLALRCDGETSSLTLPSELFGDPNALPRAIARHGGETFTACAGMQRHLAPPCSLSPAIRRRSTYRLLGWAQIAGRRTYLTPGCAASADGTLSDPPEVELEARLRDYALTEAPWEESLKALLAAAAVFPTEYAAALLAFALLPLVQRFFPGSTTTRASMPTIGPSPVSCRATRAAWDAGA